MSRQAIRQIKPTIAANVKTAREAKGLTQHELAVAIGSATGAQTVSRWERSQVVPSPRLLIRLAEVLEQDVAWFYTDHITKDAG